MKKEYSAPEFEYIELLNPAIMKDFEFVESVGDTKEEDDGLDD